MLRQFDYWSRKGPPLSVAVRAVGRVLGIDWTPQPSWKDSAVGVEMPLSGPSIAELARTMGPLRAGIDTLQASREVFRALEAAG